MARASRFFRQDDFEFLTEIALGATAYRAAEAGEVLATVGRVKNGDYSSWVREWEAMATRVQWLAHESEQAGRRVSARESYLRASTYYFNAAFFVLGTHQGRRLQELWRSHRDCFERAAALFDPPFERVAIPYEQTMLEGWFFPAAIGDADARRPLAILNNGSDGTLTDMWVQGAAAGTARGYHCLTFDGPGQGSALFEQGLSFRPDWEQVVTPVVDYACSRVDVDPERIALLGVSQAGYWVPRAIAFEPRIAAAVADPGVVDVSEAMTSQLPSSMKKLLKEGNQAKFDSQIHLIERFSNSLRFTMKFRSVPYGTESPFELFKRASEHRLDPEIAGRIRCPLAITDPENEPFWPGQSQRLAAMVGERATVIPFSAEEGADGHCEPRAPVLRAQRIFDWLDTHLFS
jgi:alpha-beta hydrolase superfamily lysophospholipase